MKNKLKNICIWILGKIGCDLIILTEEMQELVKKAIEVTKETDKIPGLISNEYRHCHSYGTLLKRNPNSRHRDIGMAIEIAMFKR
jgi:hypothetical protein